MQRHDGQEGLPHLRDLPQLDRASRDDALHGRADLGVLQLELREGQVRARLGQRRLRADDVGLLHRHLMPLALRPGERALELGHPLLRLLDTEHLGGELGLRLLHRALGLDLPAVGRLHGRARRRLGGLGLLVVAQRHETALDQLLLPVHLAGGLDGGGLGPGRVRCRGGRGRAHRLHLGLGFLHGGQARRLARARALERPARFVTLRRRHPARHGQLRAQAHRRRFRHRDGGRRLVALGAEVARIHAHEQVARLDVLVVLDEELGDIAHDLRADHGHGALDIGIVGRDVAAGMPPGPATVEEPREGDEGGGADDDPPSLVGYAVHAGLALREGLPTSSIIAYVPRDS